MSTSSTDSREETSSGTPRPAPLTIAVTGATGTVGRRVTTELRAAGNRVITLERTSDRSTTVAAARAASRSADPETPMGSDGALDETSRPWNPEAPADDLLDGVDSLIHIAGAPIFGRFTEQHRATLWSSRVEPTRALARLAARSGLSSFVSASAVGYYGYDVPEPTDEDAPRGEGFLSELCAAWEAACGPARDAGVRVVSVRSGLVLDGRGGMLPLLARLTSWGINGPLAGGEQWFAWVGGEDIARIYRRAATDAVWSGAVNAVGPTPATNAEITKILGKALHRPTILPVPAVAPRLLLGRQGARELALADQHIVSSRLPEWGFDWATPTAEDAIRAELA